MMYPVEAKTSHKFACPAFYVTREWEGDVHFDSALHSEIVAILEGYAIRCHGYLDNEAERNIRSLIFVSIFAIWCSFLEINGERGKGLCWERLNNNALQRYLEKLLDINNMDCTTCHGQWTILLRLGARLTNPQTCKLERAQSYLRFQASFECGNKSDMNWTCAFAPAM